MGSPAGLDPAAIVAVLSSMYAFSGPLSYDTSSECSYTCSRTADNTGVSALGDWPNYVSRWTLADFAM